MGMVRDDELCRDILSDSFEMLWNHIGEVDEAVEKSYLFRTGSCGAYPRCRRRVRAQRRAVCDAQAWTGCVLL